ncbi:MAG: histidine kinase [Oscillatoriaceae cyanobacterium Prado104]|jgi:two-component system clock-associated histidine kinase SasA|nr:histidine kinase [Oscillatoriaceae cyanobacterium Prado104]
MVNYFHPIEKFNHMHPAIGPKDAGCSPEQQENRESLLQLLLFVDKRPSSREQTRNIRKSLQALKAECDFELEVIDVGEQPDLAEHFKLVATPSLLKIHPDPRQILTGSNLMAQLEHWWPRWQLSAEECAHGQQAAMTATDANRTSKFSVACTAELAQLSDEVFRLKQEKEHLQEQLQLKDRIIAMLAHDLRNPLTAASLALETLESSQKVKEGDLPRLTPSLAAHLMKQAKRQIRIVDRMITDILQAARGTNAQLRIEPKKIELGAICQEVILQFKDKFRSKNLKLEIDIPTDLPSIYADPDRIQQVIANLLDNATKYTPEQGTVSISILHRTAYKVQVSIGDSGPGIPEENLQSIFEDRFRLQRDESTDGYGIGLSLCQRIVRSHYGQIWADSKAGKGSCFHFTLPVGR